MKKDYGPKVELKEHKEVEAPYQELYSQLRFLGIAKQEMQMTKGRACCIPGCWCGSPKGRGSNCSQCGHPRSWHTS